MKICKKIARALNIPIKEIFINHKVAVSADANINKPE